MGKLFSQHFLIVLLRLNENANTEFKISWPPGSREFVDWFVVVYLAFIYFINNEG